MATSGPNTRDWSALPDAAIYSISQRLPMYTDYYPFAGACREWRSVAKSAESEFIARHRPIVFPDEFNCPGVPHHGSLSGTGPPHGDTDTARLVDVCDGYVIRQVTDAVRGEKLLLFDNPFTHDEIRGIPPIVVSSICWAVILGSPSSPECKVVAFCNGHLSVVGEMIFCRPGDDKWCVGAKEDTGSLRSPVVLGQKVYTLDDNYEVIVIYDFEFASRQRLPAVQKLEIGPYRMILSLGHAVLAKAGGSKLWLVVFCLHVETRRGRVVVTELDVSGEPKWRTLESLGRRALLSSFTRCLVSEEPSRWGGKENWVYTASLHRNTTMVHDFEYRPWKHGIISCLSLPSDHRRRRELGSSVHPCWILPGSVYTNNALGEEAGSSRSSV